MPKKFRVSLSSQSFGELLNKLNLVEKVINEATIEGVREVANESISVIKAKTPVDTGATITSTNIEQKEGKVIITQEGDHVFENEFGDGNYGKQKPYPVPIPSVYNFTNEGDYTFTPTNPSSKYYHKDKYGKPKQVHSEGQVASAQMYNGAQYIRGELAKRIKQKGRGGLSKI